MIEDKKREIDLEIAKMLRMEKKPDNKLKLSQKNQDTSFDIFYDIFNKDNESFFYIIMQENTANAPFYYIRSFTIKDLHDINKIFKVFEENNFDEIKGYIQTLFEKNKIILTFELKREDIINMELNVVLFANPDKINLKLYREMIPQEEKDQKLLELYNLEKNKNKLLKEIKSIIEANVGNQKNKEIINNIKHILTSIEIPGIEDLKEDKKEIPKEIPKEMPKEVIKNSDLSNDINAQIFPDLRKVYNFSKKNGNFNIFLTIKNIFDEDWPQGSFKLVYNEEHIRCKEVINCAYDIGKGQDGDFIVCFDGKDLKPGKKYKCCLQLYVNEKKVTDEDAIFKIRISD